MNTPIDEAVPQDVDILSFSKRDAIAMITLNRPQVRNAIDDALREEMIGLLQHVGADDDIRALIITGAGSAFSSGGDIKGMRQRLSAPVGRRAINGWRRQKSTHRLIETLYTLEKPTIAAVNGPAAGLGCDLAMACDVILAGESASFTMSYIKRGLIPDGGSLYLLPRRVGTSMAKQLIFGGHAVTAQEALRIGLADRVAADEVLISQARELALSLSEGSGTALALAKSILNRSGELSLQETFALGGQAQAICYTTDEHWNAVQAFLAPRSVSK